ncbi:MAG TPA: 3-hydroxyisobutyrate dehydrogenase [Xanthobacteraceae bacterium]|jgi:3-hydroxyisobutyrate dehydrogenase|nr:3-hydroxyisobutyrate dehydrogenase [Xanthobacteraceae bacterium]
MAKIGFIGLGNMGLPMAKNLIKAEHSVCGYDISAVALDKLSAAGGIAARSLDVASMGVDVVITMLPGREQVREVYLGQGGVLASAAAATLLIDCSTVDVETARAVAAAAKVNELDMLDAPVSGGVSGAESGTLTFMVGGPEQAVERAKPVLDAMGKAVIHVGEAGSGQAAKICNNMILGISMIAVSEAFVLAEKLGLDPKKLFEVSAQSTSQCWSMTSYCPMPGLVPSSPANNDYQPGFTVALMLKDLKLAQDAARSTRAVAPLSAGATAIYQHFFDGGGAGTDFSGIIRYLRDASAARAEQS